MTKAALSCLILVLSVHGLTSFIQQPPPPPSRQFPNNNKWQSKKSVTNKHDRRNYPYNDNTGTLSVTYPITLQNLNRSIFSSSLLLLGSSSSSSSSTISSSNSSHNEKEFDIETISQDPKCFLVHNMLSVEECEEYISRANYEIESSKLLSNTSDEDNSDQSSMKRSNAPEVSIQLSRLWPLPFLCLGAGLPPIVKLFIEASTSTTNQVINTNSITINQILSAALPNISIASIITILSIITITQTMKSYAQQYTRTSQSIALNQPTDFALIQKLVSNACQITNQKWYQWEAPVITKYEKDALFASHNDASPTKGSEWDDIGGQRIVTVITYLNTCEEGGGTKFDKLNFIVQPKQGSALVFFPADKDTLVADERTVHQSLPAIDEKYIVQLFGRCKRVPPPLGIPDSFSDQ